MKRSISLIIIFLAAHYLFAQDLRHYEDLNNLGVLSGTDTLNHSSIRDLYFFTHQSNFDRVSATSSRKWCNYLYNKVFNDNFVIIKQPGYRITADPLFDLETGRAGKNSTWVNTRGAQVHGVLDLGDQSHNQETRKHPEFEFYASYYESQSRLPGYIDSLASISGGVPGQGAILTDGGIWDHGYATGWIRYRARRFFTFEFGTGKNFFGNGYRSMLLSDNARNAPYFRIDTKLWRFHYTNLWTEYQDNQYHDGPMGAYQKKYGAFHYLSYSVTRRLELSLFEAIIWQGRDSLHTRGFEINYLNPVIFMRPVEWSLGSPDNAMIGTNVSYRLFDHTLCYGQLLLDDFPLDHLKARDGYWGNKFSGQLGMKTWIPLIESADRQPEAEEHRTGIVLQSEFNFARPYTYSHWTTKQNYGHLGQPIAHPLGANFFEWVNFARYHNHRWIVEGRYSWAKFGANYNGLNYGQDIFIPNTNYVNELGNYIGQGRSTTLQYTSVTLSYLFNPSSLLNVFCTLTSRLEKTDSWNKHNCWFTLGIRNSIRNFYFDY